MNILNILPELETPDVPGAMGSGLQSSTNSGSGSPFDIPIPGIGSIPGLSIPGAVVDKVDNAAKSTLSALNPFQGLSVSGVVTILIGLILIAAGIFSFKESRALIVSAAKTAAVAA